jgi:hypothetical protein
MPSPTVTPKPTNTEDSAVAANAPSTTGDHSTKRHPLSFRATGVVSFRAAGGIFSIDISMALAKAEEGKNCQNHNDETDEIYESVHELLPLTCPLLTDNLLVPAKFPISRKNVQCLGVACAWP